MLDLKTMWPFPEETIKKICADASNVFVVEMNRGQVVGEAAKILRKANVLPILRNDTKIITPGEIESKIKEVLK